METATRCSPPALSAMTPTPRHRAARLVVGLVIALGVAASAAVFWAGGPARPDPVRERTLVDPRGEPAPTRRPTRVRLLVADLGLLVGANPDHWPPSDVVETRLEAVIEHARSFRPDVLVIYDTPLESRRWLELDAAEQIAAHLDLHYRVETASLSRRYAFSPRRGSRALGHIAAGPLVLSRWPLWAQGGGPIRGERLEPWGSLPSSVDLEVQAGPDFRFTVQVTDGVPASAGDLRISRGSSFDGAAVSNDRLAVAVPEEWRVLRARTDNDFDGNLPTPALKIEIRLPALQTEESQLPRWGGEFPTEEADPPAR